MSIACPYCKAVLTPKGLKPGKYVPKCPKCGNPFSMTVPAEPGGTIAIQQLVPAKKSQAATDTVRARTDASEAGTDTVRAETKGKNPLPDTIRMPHVKPGSAADTARLPVPSSSPAKNLPANAPTDRITGSGPKQPPKPMDLEEAAAAMLNDVDLGDVTKTNNVPEPVVTEPKPPLKPAPKPTGKPTPPGAIEPTSKATPIAKSPPAPHPKCEEEFIETDEAEPLK